MDKIIMKNFKFYGYHGVLDFEKKDGQYFYINIKMTLDLKDAGINDDLNKTINYAEASSLIKGIIENERYDLIEAVAERIAAVLLNNYDNLEEIEVEVRKPQAPIDEDFDYVSVIINRSKNNV